MTAERKIRNISNLLLLLGLIMTAWATNKIFIGIAMILIICGILTQAAVDYCKLRQKW